MTNRPPSTASEDAFALRELREEIDQIYATVKQTQMAVLLLARSIEQLRDCDASARQPVRAPLSPASCGNCGSHLDCHHAEAGDLLICPVCGWSDFVAFDGDQPKVPAAMAERPVTPIPAGGWV